jgi:hypothetical protein
MPSPEIEEFARILVQRVRDTAIQSCDMRFRQSAASAVAKRWRGAAEGSVPEAFAKVLIPDVVDETLASLLLAIDQQLLRLSFTTSTGKSTDLVTDGFGELCGWYKGGGGWCERYSKERFVDDFSGP